MFFNRQVQYFVFKRGKESLCDSIDFGEDQDHLINQAKVEDNKHLGIIEKDDVPYNDMKKRTEKEFL